MGCLSRFRLESIIDNGVTCYIETGLGRGNSLSHAINSNFTEYHTCEIDPYLIEQAKEQFENKDNITYHLGYSHETLEELLKTLPADIRCMFWLDAHFPFSDGGSIHVRRYSDENTVTNIPLETELKLISKYRFNCNDIVFCDDLRIYEDHNYDGGTWTAEMPVHLKRPGAPLIFLKEMYEHTHYIHRFTFDQGYLCMFPKDWKGNFEINNFSCL